MTFFIVGIVVIVLAECQVFFSINAAFEIPEGEAAQAFHWSPHHLAAKPRQEKHHLPPRPSLPSSGETNMQGEKFASVKAVGMAQDRNARFRRTMEVHLMIVSTSAACQPISQSIFLYIFHLCDSVS